MTTRNPVKMAVLFCSISALMSACLNKDNPSSTAADTTSDSGGSSPSLASQLVGTWKTACSSGASINGAAQWVKYQLNVTHSATSMVWMVEYFTNSSCASSSASYTVVGNATLNIGGGTSTPADGNQIDITINSTNVSAETSAAASYLNTTCGNHWTWNASAGYVTYNIPTGGMSCGNSLFNQYGYQTLVRNVIVLSGNTLGTGSFTGTMPGAYNSALPTSTSLAFTKQ